MSSPSPKRAALRRLCVLLSAASGSVFAADPVPLPAVVVDVLRAPTALDRVVADVVVIDRERIRDSGADSLEDLLRREGGIQFTRNGGPGQIAGVLMRGASSNNTVVVVDGVRVGSATLGQTDLSVLSLGEIERIEILRGPGSSLYGADAVGGVVRVVTRRGQGKPVVTANLAAGELRGRLVEAAVAGASGAFDMAASLSRESSRGVSAVRDGVAFGVENPDADGFTRQAGALRLGAALSPGHRVGLSVSRSTLDGQFDNPYAVDASLDFRRRDRAEIAAVDWRGQWSPAAATAVRLSQQDDRTRSLGEFTERFDTRRRQVTVEQTWNAGALGEWLFALDRLDERIAGTTTYAEDTRRNTGLVVGWTGRFGAHRLQADLRGDDNSVYGGVTTGKLGWAMDLTKTLTVRAVAGTAFRAPSFNELYYPNYGAPVDPERSSSIEAGLRWRDGDSSAGVTVYRNRVRDLIGYEPSPAACGDAAYYSFGCAANIGRARLQGLTVDAAHRIGAWSARATLDLLDAKDLATGDRLARRAAHSGSAGVAWSAGAWSAGADLVGVGARPEGGRLASYEVLDLHARWQAAPNWRVEAQLRNALDRDVEPVRDYRAPGRQAWIGLRFDSAGF
jgi:vitamin B12 transporter